MNRDSRYHILNHKLLDIQEKVGKMEARQRLSSVLGVVGFFCTVIGFIITVCVFYHKWKKHNPKKQCNL